VRGYPLLPVDPDIHSRFTIAGIFPMAAIFSMIAIFPMVAISLATPKLPTASGTRKDTTGSEQGDNAY
jgi:hypothetical protein